MKQKTIKKITHLKYIQSIMLLQSLLIVLFGYFVIKNKLSLLIIFLLMSSIILIRLFLPYEYWGGFKSGQKNIFFKRITPLAENMIVNLIILVSVFLLVWLF